MSATAETTAAFVVRAGRVVHVAAAAPPAEAVWTAADVARSHAVAARLLQQGVKQERVGSLAAMATWRAKWPSLRFAADAEAELAAALPPL